MNNQPTNQHCSHYSLEFTLSSGSFRITKKMAKSSSSGSSDESSGDDDEYVTPTLDTANQKLVLFRVPKGESFLV
jgi:hypothetical protein